MALPPVLPGGAAADAALLSARAGTFGRKSARGPADPGCSQRVDWRARASSRRRPNKLAAPSTSLLPGRWA